MAGDLTYQGIKRITYLPQRDDKDNGTIIGGQEYTNIYAIGGTITGVTLNPSNLTVLDNAFTIQDNLDNTKQVQFQASPVSAGTTATLSVPPASTTLVGTDSTQTLTNKTINGASNTLTVRLANDVTGTLPVANGGTGAVTLTGYVKGTGTAALTASATIPSTDISGLGSMATQNSNSVAITGGSIAGVSFNASNAGFSIQDTNASHSLIISPGSDLSANRTFTLTTGDANRTLTMSGNATISGTNTGDQTITLTGDVTGSGTGSFAATIANDAVTYAKMQNVSAASRLLGRGSAAGAGDVEEITLSGLTMSGTVLTNPSPFTEEFISSEQTVPAAAGLLDVAHTLTARPKLAQLLLICKTAELNYSVNDIIVLNDMYTNGGSTLNGTVVYDDATNVYFRNGNAGIFISNKTTGAATAITGGNWRIIIQAWR